MITYKELAKRISEMPKARQEDHATVFVSGVGEAYAVTEFGCNTIVDVEGDIDGVLDDGHYIINI